MTFKSAESWPKEFTRNKDTFSKKTVTGDIYLAGQSPASAPVTTGPRPCDKFVKVDNGVNTVFWRNKDTGAIVYVDPCPKPPPLYQPKTKNKTLKKTDYWCIKVFGTYGGYSAAAYQVWSDTGVVDESNPNGLFLRRNGSFKATGGKEWFVPMKTDYLPRHINRTYVSSGDAVDARFDAAESTSTSSNVYTPEQIAQAQAIAAGVALVFGANTIISDPVDSGNNNNNNNKNKNKNKKNLPAAPPLPIPEITITTRMPSGYAGSGLAIGARPQMVQRYRTDDNKYADETFIFRYIPQGIKYSGLSGNWVEVPRAEDIPFVDWASWQLMKVSFSFIVAADRTEPGGTVVPDGLDVSVDGQIERLRNMAQRKVPVTLMNFDEMLTFQLRRGKKAASTGTQVAQPNMEFVIQDLSVTATRRTSAHEARPNANPPVAAIASTISVAQCEITLTEIPVETVGIIALPPITTPGLPPSKKKPPTRPADQKYADFTQDALSPDAAFSSYVPVA